MSTSFAQKNEMIKVVKDKKTNKINVMVGDKLFTSFLYPVITFILFDFGSFTTFIISFFCANDEKLKIIIIEKIQSVLR